jgi:hypothetical protein
MSILPIIKAHTDAPERRLVMLDPFLPYDPVVRHMAMSQEVANFVLGPWSNADAEKRCARVRADLDAFVIGALTSICLAPFEAEDERFGLLRQERFGIFDLRCYDPRPNIRILGGFAEQDWFVALTFHPRSVAVPWIPRVPLGCGGSAEWASAIHDTREAWRDLFGDVPPRTGSTPDVFLTNYYCKGT